jgi:hypothetical protein
MRLIPSVRTPYQCFDRLLVVRMFGFHERHPARQKPVALIVALSRMSMTTRWPTTGAVNRSHARPRFPRWRKLPRSSLQHDREASANSQVV